MNNDINNIPHDDPRFTAYVLGELDQTQRAEIERLIETDPAARFAVDELRSTADLLSAELKSEPCPSLTDEQRRAIKDGEPAPVIHTFRIPRMWIGSGLAAAAALATAFILIHPAARDAARSEFLRDKNMSERADVFKSTPKGKEPLPPISREDAATAGQLMELQSDLREAGQLAGAGASNAKIDVLSKTADQELAFTAASLGQATMVLEDAAKAEQSPAASPSITAGLANRGVTTNEKSVAAPTPPPYTGLQTFSVTAQPAPGAGSGGGDGYGGGMPARARIKDQSGRIADGRRNYPEVGKPAELPGLPGSDGDGDRLKLHARNDKFVRQLESLNTENYARIIDNPFLSVTGNPLSTFSTDVDTASYSNMRRFLAQGALPPPDAVRIEELINYFRYDYAPPAKDADAPFAAHIEVNACPWSPAHRLVRVGLKGREIAMDQRPATNLVFLIDTSGSMQPENKLPLLQKSMKQLVDQLNGDDRLAIVTYAGTSGLALPSTYCMDKAAIKNAISELHAGGSTNGAAGIQLAYDVATEHLIQGGVNRVILATDGDFNVGISDEGGLVKLIEEKRATGVSLSVLGFGEGNLQDAKMEKLADHGNGNYAYIDTEREGRKVLVEQATGTLVTIAKDVKIQIEFNPLQVAAYRLIGYENRVMAAQDFNDDRKDAGEIGAGHTVTALYEIVPVGAAAPVDQQIVDLQKQVESIDNLVVTARLSDAAMKELQQKRAEAQNKLASLKDVAPPQQQPPPIDPLKYQKPAAPPPDPNPAPAAEPTDAATSGELLTLKLRYKQPEGDISKLIEFPVKAGEATLDSVSTDFRFAAAVASFGMILRDSPYRGASTFAAVLDLAQSARGEDVGGYRGEFIDLVNKAKALRGE